MFASVYLSAYFHTGVTPAALFTVSKNSLNASSLGSSFYVYLKKKAQCFFWHKLGGKFPSKLCLHSGGGRSLWLPNANSSPLASLNVKDGSSVIQTHGTKTLRRDETQKGGRSIMETYWIRMENVISIFMYAAPVRVCVCACGCGRPCCRRLRLSGSQAWGGFDVTEAVPVKRRFNTVMLWPGCRARLH